MLLLGDFNTNHPDWGGIGAACDQEAEHLLLATGREGLDLITATGEPTWRRNAQESTIDLTFVTQRLHNRVIFCGPIEEWALTKDHIPIKIELGVKPGESLTTSRRFALQKLKSEKLNSLIRSSGWEDQEDPLDALQNEIQKALPQCCPRARPSPRARANWSPRASELLAGARRARRRYTVWHQEEDNQEAKHLSNQLQQEMRRNSRNNWRRIVAEIAKEETKSGYGLWRLSRWSRRKAGESHADPHLPALREDEEGIETLDNQQRVQILANRFFPPPLEVDLRDVVEDAPASSSLDIAKEVTEEEIHILLRNLPKGRTPGPTEIPNEVLQALSPTIDAGLAHAISRAFTHGELPSSYKESTTIVLRKEGKKDYSLPGSYRPICLENTLAKVVEKALANRITDAAEEHNLLLWNQMGARRDRSTLSAMGLLSTYVETAWTARPGSVVSMLSLDLTGAYDNVSHERLLAVLRRKEFPEWLVAMVACFLQGRRTRIAYTGHESDWIPVQSGIPQGSPLSPILFLFYISELLESLSDPQEGLIGLGFIDDTNLIT